MCGLGAARAALRDLGHAAAPPEPDGSSALLTPGTGSGRPSGPSWPTCSRSSCWWARWAAWPWAPVAAARSTESSFSDLVASSHVPQLFVFDGVINPAIGLDSAYNPALLRTLSHLPHVERVASTVELNVGPLTSKGQPLPHPVHRRRGERQRVGLHRGPRRHRRRDGWPIPHKANEFVLDAATAKALGYHLGEEVPMGWLTNAQTQSGNISPEPGHPRGPARPVRWSGSKPGRRARCSRTGTTPTARRSCCSHPALTDKLLACCSNDMLSGLTLQGGNRYLAAVESEVQRVLPKGLPFVYVQSENVAATADATLRPEAIALGVFGGHRGVATLLIGGPGGQPSDPAAEQPISHIARALGASPTMNFWDGLLGTCGALVLGSLLAGRRGRRPLAPRRPWDRYDRSYGRGARRLGRRGPRRGRPGRHARGDRRWWLRS